MSGCLSDWPAFYRSAYEAIRPGGWIEQVEMSFKIQSEDEPLPDDHPLVEWGSLLLEVGCNSGISLQICESMAADIENAGFQRVVEKLIDVPLDREIKVSVLLKTLGRTTSCTGRLG